MVMLLNFEIATFCQNLMLILKQQDNCVVTLALWLCGVGMYYMCVPGVCFLVDLPHSAIFTDPFLCCGI